MRGEPGTSFAEVESGDLRSRLAHEIAGVGVNLQHHKDQVARIAPDKLALGDQFEFASPSQARADRVNRHLINVDQAYLRFLQRAQEQLDKGKTTIDRRSIEDVLAEKKTEYEEAFRGLYES